VLRKTFSDLEQVLALFVALRAGKEFADGIERSLDIDIAKLREDVCRNLDDALDSDAWITTNGRLDRPRLRLPPLLYGSDDLLRSS
jgi:hypothetical protein